MKNKNKLLKYDLLVKLLKTKKKIAIAFSGGIDSTLLAFASKQAEIDVILITVISPFFSKYDEEYALKIAQEFDLRIIFISQDIDENVSNNPLNRCYLCKKEEASIWKKIANQQGYSIIADGANIDDVNDKFRPGIKACNEQGIWHPFAELKISKNDIRTIAKQLNISNWNRPSNACLASRIQYGEKITIKKLHMIEKAEDFLRKISPQVRVRLHQNIARIEVPSSHFISVIKMRKEINSYMTKVGFNYITLDLTGYRSGSMNEIIDKNDDLP
jgi:uncharacterized protein